MPTILVADDNSNIQKMVSLVFQEKGMHVVAVGNGEAACRKVPEVKPDIVLADVFMPVRNGYEVCEFVKRDSRFSETPVILLVGAFDPLDEKEARRVGADGVLKKPFVPPEPLISLVGSLLQKSGKPEEVAIQVPAPESPAPPVSIAPPPPPEPPRGYQTEPEPEPGSQEDQFAYGAVGRDAIPVDDEATSEHGPMATPFAPPEEPQDDNTESASDWRRRRASMDYEIPTEDSDSMVEHLAGESPVPAAPAEEVAQSSEELPAPIHSHEEPQHETAAPVSSHVSSSEWSSYVPAAREESAAPVPEPPKSEEIPVSLVESDSSMDAPVAEISLETASEEPPTSYSFVAEREAARNVESHSSHFDSPERRTAQEESASASPSVIPFPAAEEASPQEFAVTERAHDEEAAASGTASAFDAAPTAHSVVEQAVQEVIAQPESSKQTNMDPATIDSIVAKVVEKLEPQLHQALSQGVLKPLIQELLKGELKSDK